MFPYLRKFITYIYTVDYAGTIEIILHLKEHTESTANHILKRRSRRSNTIGSISSKVDDDMLSDGGAHSIDRETVNDPQNDLDGGHVLRIEIRDSGPGINKSKQSKIFSKRNKFNGQSGVGLWRKYFSVYLCR